MLKVIVTGQMNYGAKFLCLALRAVTLALCATATEVAAQSPAPRTTDEALKSAEEWTRKNLPQAPPPSPSPSPSIYARPNGDAGDSLWGSDGHASRWQYQQQSDEMGRGVSKFARLASTNRLSFGFPYEGPQYVELTVRNTPKHGKNVYLWIERGQFHCSGIDGCTVSVRFDNGPIQTFAGQDASDGDSRFLFITPYQRFMAGLRKAKNLRIEAEFFHQGVRVIEFDVAGLNPP